MCPHARAPSASEARAPATRFARPQAQMELLVTRTSDPEPALRLTALETMVQEVRTSTSSMTSVPKPLKFLRPHFGTLKENYEKASAGPAKTMMADVLSLLAMTMGEDSVRESLSYKLLGSREDLGSWGHEYVRHLAGEIGRLKARPVRAPLSEGDAHARVACRCIWLHARRTRIMGR